MTTKHTVLTYEQGKGFGETTIDLPIDEWAEGYGPAETVGWMTVRRHRDGRSAIVQLEGCTTFKTTAEEMDLLVDYDLNEAILVRSRADLLALRIAVAPLLHTEDLNYIRLIAEADFVEKYGRDWWDADDDAPVSTEGRLS